MFFESSCKPFSCLKLFADNVAKVSRHLSVQWSVQPLNEKPNDFYSRLLPPTLKKVAATENVVLIKAATIGEDFSYFQEIVPGHYFFLGGMTSGNTEAFPHHTPDFVIDESGMLLGVKTMTQLAIDYLEMGSFVRSVACCLLSVACCLLSVACCLLSVVCCLLSVVCKEI